MAGFLAKITLFPIKALDGVAVQEAVVQVGGALGLDRRWAIVDTSGRVVNGKRLASIQRIRASYNLRELTVDLRQATEAKSTCFSLLDDQVQIAQWISDAIHIECRLIENSVTGFPDDTAAPGPTLVSSATLAEVASWFQGISLDESRRRFRANLEVDGVPAFWEDHLIGPVGTEVPFRIARTHWLGVNCCQRCVVPTRDSSSSEANPLFQKAFARERERQLPPWAERSRFNHFYRLCVNTRLATTNSVACLYVGDPVALGT